MEGITLCLVIAISMFGLGDAVQSRRSFLSNRNDYNTLYENDYNKILTENTDSRGSLNDDTNERISSFKGKIIVNKFKAYLYKLIDRYENDDEIYNGNEVDREENEEMALQNVDAKDYDNKIGNHLYNYDRIYLKNKENVWENEIQKEKLKSDDYLDENADDNIVENNEDENTDEKDDNYWQERENFEDNMENRKDKEFGMMDYLLDTNWAEEGKALKDGFGDIQRVSKMDGDYIADDYFDNSDYEA